MTVTNEEIHLALTRPPDFGYFGELDLFNTWGLCGPARHRDSGPLDNSNYEVILADLEDRFPNDVEEVSSNHWGVGWVDQIAVRVIEKDGGITPAFEALIDWKHALEEYPVADESDYSKREWEDFVETIENCYYDSELKDDLPEDWVENVASWLFDTYSIRSSEEISGELVDEAYAALDYLDKEEENE